MAGPFCETNLVVGLGRGRNKSYADIVCIQGRSGRANRRGAWMGDRGLDGATGMGDLESVTEVVVVVGKIRHDLNRASVVSLPCMRA